jgi:two-component system, sensor histidine kinase PdtaS
VIIRIIKKKRNIKNELVENQNREKTAMLKEIHHRVKKNLQVITSLLRLQTRDLTNEETIKHFKEAIDRVGAMALIHNQMYQSKDLDRIELEPYLESLSDNILSSYSLEIPVKIAFNIEVIYTKSSLIVPLALIFNELMSNSLKHAFTTKAFGEIEVKIKEINENQIQFVYRDNGEWKSPI